MALWTVAHQAPLSSTVSYSLFKFMFIKSVILSNHLIILCHFLLLLPSIFPSIRVFSNESALQVRWPKYWSFSIGPCSEYSGLISFRIDWFDILAVQGTLKNLLQQHRSKVSILWHSTFFMVQLLHPYMITGKTIPLTIWTFDFYIFTLLHFTLDFYIFKIHLAIYPFTSVFNQSSSIYVFIHISLHLSILSSMCPSILPFFHLCSHLSILKSKKFGNSKKFQRAQNPAGTICQCSEDTGLGRCKVIAGRFSSL